MSAWDNKVVNITKTGVQPQGGENGVEAEIKLPFFTGEQIANEFPKMVDWIAQPWVAKGAITEVDGQVKTAGKTTWITHMCKAVIDGVNFLGQPTRKSPIVYLTEQPRVSFRLAMELAGLLGRKEFAVLFWNDIRGLSWKKVAEQAVNEAKRIGAELIVVDTIAQFAGIQGDRENNSGDALTSMRPLMRATGTGLGIVVVRHERKAGGRVGKSGRGSSAFSGTVDIVLCIRRGEGKDEHTVREIESLSRFDETPEKYAIELTDKGYVALDEADRAEAISNKVLEVLPESENDAMEITEISKRSEVGRTSVQRALEKLKREGKIGSIGEGKRNDPIRYYGISEFLSA